VLEAPSAYIGGYMFIVGSCKCWRLHVLALEGTCLLLEVVSVGGYMCLHWKLECLHWKQHVFALKVASVRSCKCSS